MDLVLDTGVVLAACLSAGGFEPLHGHQLHGLDLMCWEAESVLHEQAWRLGRGWAVPEAPGLTLADVQRGFANLLAATRRAGGGDPLLRSAAFGPRLAEEAWLVAERCGFAKVYDAAPVALARTLGCRLVTLDARLRRGPASRLATIVGPTEL